MDYAAFCRHYFEATHLPVDLLQDENPVFSSLGSLMGIDAQVSFDLFPMNHNPSFCTLNSDLEYGRIHIENTHMDIILGPAFSVPMTEELAQMYIRELMLPAEKKDRMREILFSLPTVSHLQLGKHLMLVHQIVNGREADSAELFGGASAFEIAHENVQTERMQNMDEGGLLNTYLYEIGLYECIKSGQEDRLVTYLRNHTRHLYEEQFAGTPLRHAKNMFAALASKMCVIGAIPGGLEVEKAYQLTGYYVRECEKLLSLEAINNLHYAMILDFCRRTGESKIPQGISSDVFSCMNFIRSHVNQPLTIGLVAEHIHRSESYVMKKFQSELGIHVGAFIMRCKLEEARSMLIYTDKSLAEISAFLCFSSQAYFQNVFKKKYDITPMQFRKQGRKVE